MRVGEALMSLVIGLALGMGAAIFIEVDVAEKQCQELEARIGTVNLVYAGYNDGCVLAEDL